MLKEEFENCALSHKDRPRIESSSVSDFETSSGSPCFPRREQIGRSMQVSDDHD